MTDFTATISHSSISRAREIDITGTLAEACKAAAAEFGAEQRDYVINVYDMSNPAWPHLAASRKVSGRNWRFYGVL